MSDENVVIVPVPPAAATSEPAEALAAQTEAKQAEHIELTDEEEELLKAPPTRAEIDALLNLRRTKVADSEQPVCNCNAATLAHRHNSEGVSLA